MSERMYVPGVSAPAPISRSVEVDILRECIEPIRSGLPSRRNPLGLWHIAHTPYSSQKPIQLKAPYRLPSRQSAEFPRISQDYETSTEIDYFVAGIYGGMIAAARCRRYFIDNPQHLRHLLTSINEVGYGLTIMSSLQYELARQYANVDRTEHSADELGEVLTSAFDVVQSGLMRIRGGDAVRTERELGLFKWSKLRNESHTHGASMHIEATTTPPMPVFNIPVPIGDQVLCGAMHVRDEEGMSLAQTTWSRVTQVGMSVPALFPKLLKATGTKR